VSIQNSFFLWRRLTRLRFSELGDGEGAGDGVRGILPQQVRPRRQGRPQIDRVRRDFAHSSPFSEVEFDFHLYFLSERGQVPEFRAEGALQVGAHMQVSPLHSSACQTDCRAHFLLFSGIGGSAFFLRGVLSGAFFVMTYQLKFF